MIKVENNNVEMHGDIISLLAEATGMIQGLYQMMITNFGKEFADDNLVLIGRMAVMSDEELEADAIAKGFVGR